MTLARGRCSRHRRCLPNADVAALVKVAMLAESKAALSRESAARRKLHNLVQELRGNIRVFVRVKPLADSALSRNGAATAAPVLTCEDGHRISCTAAGSTKVRKTVFVSQSYCNLHHLVTPSA